MMSTEAIVGEDLPLGNIEVYDSVKRFALNGLSDLIRVLMENMDDSLFELSEKAESDRQRNMYFEAMRELRLKQESLRSEFDQSMAACFDGFARNLPENHLDDDPEELTLVEFEDLEDSIAIDNMISKARPLFEDDLFAVAERLKVLFRRDHIDQDLNPLDPKAICDSFHQAAEVIDSEVQVKLIFYKLFDKYVMNSLGGFYRELNGFFVEKGVLPEFKLTEARKQQTTRFMATRIRNSAGEIGESPAVDGSPLAQTEPDPSDQMSIEDGNVLSMLRQVLTQSSSNTLLSGSVQGSSLQAPGKSQSGGQVPVAQNAAYMEALTNLQVQSLQSEPLEAIDPQQARADTRQQLVAFSQVNADQASPAESQIIDVVSMLFDFFFDDESLPAPIKVLIGRLQIPILKIAMLDETFFNQKKHPARKLLDGISKATLGWGSDAKQEKLLVDKIEQVVNRLVTDFDEDIQVFETALDEIERFLEEENEKIRLADEKIKLIEQESERLIKQSEDAASQLIGKLTAKRELNFEITQFLDTTWKSILFHIYLTMGESSNHWKNIRRISSTLIWTLIPKFSEEERVKILATLPPLLRAMSKGMGLIEIDTEAQNKIFQMLAKQHSEIVKQTSKNIVTRIDDKTVWPEGAADAFAGYTRSLANEEVDIVLGTDATGNVDLVEKPDDPDAITIISESDTNEVIQNLNDFTSGVKKGEIVIEQEITMTSNRHTAEQDADEFVQQAKSMDPGTWIRFTDEGNKTYNARLSWKGNLADKYVFSSRLGYKVKEVSLYGLATELRSNRAVLIHYSSVFDRAIDTIVSKIAQ